MACSGPCSNITHRTLLVVRNLPECTTDLDVQILIGAFGQIYNITMPHNTAADGFTGDVSIEFENNTLARQIVATMNYCMYGGHTLHMFLVCLGPAHTDDDGARYVCVSNLPRGIGKHAFEGIFEMQGPILRSMVLANEGVGIVEFGSEEGARTACEELNGTLVADARTSEFRSVRVEVVR